MVSVRMITNIYDDFYRRSQIKEDSGGANIATWQFYGPGRVAEMQLGVVGAISGNTLYGTFLANSRRASAVQNSLPNPAWGDVSSDRLGYDGAMRPIAKRYLITSLSGDAYAGTTATVGATSAYDRASNKTFERALHAEVRSSLYEPIDTDGNVGSIYDSLDRLLQYQRGSLTTTAGLLGTGGGSITAGGTLTLSNADQNRTYALDGLGNWQSTSYYQNSSGATTENRSHNQVNEITGIITTGGTSSTAAFTYDANGNLLNDGLRSYQYDAFNLLLTVKNPAGSTTWGAYSYDAMGRRIRKVVSNGGYTGSATNGTTDFIYDGQQIVEDRDGSNNPASQYVWGQYIDELIQLRTVESLVDQFLLSDLLYRAAALVKYDGTIVEAYDTDAYGNTLVFNAAGSGGDWFANNAGQTTGTPKNRYIFTGREYDAESQIYFYRARYYAPKWGRFLGRDLKDCIGRLTAENSNQSYKPYVPSPLPEAQPGVTNRRRRR